LQKKKSIIVKFVVFWVVTAWTDADFSEEHAASIFRVKCTGSRISVIIRGSYKEDDTHGERVNKRIPALISENK
jgi:hypothetical protein